MSLPPNVHISTHPLLRAKLSQLRSQSTNARETKQLVHEIATMIGYEALATGLETTSSKTDKSPIGYEYTTETISPSDLSLVPILRSGLGMVDGTSSYALLSPLTLYISPLYLVPPVPTAYPAAAIPRIR